MGSSKVSRTKGLLSSSEIIAEIINNLLHQRELRYPKGVPLFSYQLSETGYNKLRSLLSAKAPTSSCLKNTHWCAAFCLFSAEWYRR